MTCTFRSPSSPSCLSTLTKRRYATLGNSTIFPEEETFSACFSCPKFNCREGFMLCCRYSDKKYRREADRGSNITLEE
ncbi:Hypothetical predicted protein [Xyrichtys novacula]|nr:Hypothetical predicted protein [Xyrichtys novacula]